MSARRAALAALLLAGCISEPDPYGPGRCKSARMLDELSSEWADLSPWMSQDRREVLFTSNRQSGQGFNIYRATRPDVVGTFSPPEKIVDDGLDPFVSADGLDLYYVRGQFGGAVVHRQHRAALGAPFGDDQYALTELGAIMHPSFTADRQTLVYAAGAPDMGDLFISHLLGDGTYASGELLAVSSANDDAAPSISAGGDQLRWNTRTFASGETQIYRSSLNGDTFMTGVMVSLDKDAYNATPFIHGDNATLLYASRPASAPSDNGFDLWIYCE